MFVKERKDALDNVHSGFAFWLIADQFGTALTKQAEICHESS